MSERSFSSGNKRGKRLGPSEWPGAECSGLAEGFGHLLSAQTEDRLREAASELLARQFPKASVLFGVADTRRRLLVGILPSFNASAPVDAKTLQLAQAADLLGLSPELTQIASGFGENVCIFGEVQPRTADEVQWRWWSGEEGAARCLLAVAAPRGATLATEKLKQWAQAIAAAVRNFWLMDYYRQAAYTDPLTGLPNRRAFNEALSRELGRYKRYGRPFSVVLIDLDDFRRVNQLLGHHGGDEVLRRVGQWLMRAVRGADLVARIGGDEFALLCPETSASQAAIVLDRLKEQIGQISTGIPLKLSLSGGVAEVSPEDATISSLLERADRELWKSKLTD